MTRIKYQEAAGLEVKRGRPQLRATATMKDRLTRLYIVQELSVREVGAAMGISEASVRRWLTVAGIPKRTNARRSRLRLLDQARLFGSIAAVGVRKTAKRWGIPERTLKSYLAGLRDRDKSE
jgi:DNA-binding transcriptional regulator LsrR (DeoR family)